MTPNNLIYLPIKVGTMHLGHSNNIRIKSYTDAYVAYHKRDMIDTCPQIFDTFRYLSWKIMQFVYFYSQLYELIPTIYNSLRIVL